MKTAQAWRGMKDMQILHAPRQRSHLKKPTWIIILVSLVSIFLICAYVYPPQNSAACYVFSSNGCKGFSNWLPPAPTREYTDEEIASRVVIRDILNTPTIESKNPKIAFLFLSQGSLPFEKLWDKFFHGHDGRFSVYVHASNERAVHTSRYFINSDIHSDKVVWGRISMVDAERRLLANALKDPDNQHFVLLSDSCIPLRDFDFVYNYLLYTNISFIDSFVDPGPHGNGRYSEHMLPEVEKKDFRKGSQTFSFPCMGGNDYTAYAFIAFPIGHVNTFGEGPYKHKLPADPSANYYDIYALKCRGYKYEFIFQLCQGGDALLHSAWFTMKRQHAVIVMADNLYYSKFRDYCKPGMDGRNCYSDEHYLPTFFHMFDPAGVANWSITHVDWSERKWHPKSYRAQDATYELIKNITSIYESVHSTSDERNEIQIRPCLWNGIRRPCYLFARKFLPETLDNLMQLFPNYTSI